MLYNEADTVCAIATPPGEGAISVIRVSGARSVDCVKKIARFLPERVESHKVYYGLMRKSDSEELLDEVMVTYFAKGRSFTGEDSVEISCHGSPAIAQNILQELVRVGVRLAERGEFTYRAFMSGRIDLAQAEAVLSLIQSQSAISAQQSLRLLRGEFSEKIKVTEDHLLWALSRLEANIDFSAEDIEFASQGEIIERIILANQMVEQLIGTFSAGKILRSGLRIALVGKPNVGKSSLLNALAEQDRAIVSTQPGTTRDSIEVQIEIGGHRVTIVDTAGLRTSNDEIEALGIERTKSEIQQADMIFHIVDASLNETHATLDLTNDKPGYKIANKADLIQSEISTEYDFVVSAVTRQGIDELRQLISDFLSKQFHESTTVVMSARQYELLLKVRQQLTKTLELLRHNESPEFVISELQDALFSLMSILGKKFDDEVLDRVFSDFCLGK